MNVKNADIFKNTMKKINEDSYLFESVENSIKNEYILFDKDAVSLDAEPSNKKADIIVSPLRTFEAAGKYRGKKVCALNFASSKNPGGGVVNGANAQEECLCRISTLYPCLADSNIFNEFYLPHRSMFSDTLYNDDLIFTPGIVWFKTDTASPVLMPKEDWFILDVITCAAPNLNANFTITATELEELHRKRIEKIFITAANEGEEVLILGAFGCGAFRNPPTIVANVMKELTDKYAYYFDTIEYAVYCSPRNPTNYNEFVKTFGTADN